MAKRYTEAQKKQILAALAGGTTQEQAAKKFKVSVGSIQNWKRGAKAAKGKAKTKPPTRARRGRRVSKQGAEFYAAKLLEGAISKKGGVVSIDLKRIKDQGLAGAPLVVKILQDQLAKALK